MTVYNPPNGNTPTASDIATVWDPQNSRGDYVLCGADLERNQDLYTACLISLFTDRLADVDDIIPDGTNDPRGWIGDDPDTQYPIGSRLWLLERAKLPLDTLLRARDYCVEALQWLIDDGVVAKFDYDIKYVALGGLYIVITPYRQDGTKMPALQYQYVWNQIAAGILPTTPSAALYMLQFQDLGNIIYGGYGVAPWGGYALIENGQVITVRA